MKMILVIGLDNWMVHGEVIKIGAGLEGVLFGTWTLEAHEH